MAGVVAALSVGTAPPGSSEDTAQAAAALTP